MYQETPSHSNNDVCPSLPRHRLTHIIRLVSPANARINDAVGARIEQWGGRIENWTMVRRLDLFEHKIIVVELGEQRARALRDELRDLRSDVKAYLEHLLYFPRDRA